MNKPTMNAKNAEPSWYMLSGWSTLILGYGISTGASSSWDLSLLRIPVSLSHMVVFCRNF